MTDTIPAPGQAVNTNPESRSTYTADSLRAYADKVAPGWHVAHKPEGLRQLWPPHRRDRPSRSTSFT